MRAQTAAEGFLALALAAAVLVTAAVFGSDRSREADLRASTWNDDRRGTHAVHLMLEELGVPVERTTEPPSAAAETGRTIVVLAPTWAVTWTESAALLDWAERGGGLVVVDAPSTPPQHLVDVSVLLHPLGLATQTGAPTSPEVSVHPGDWSAGMHPVQWPARLTLAEHEPANRDARAGDAEDLVTNDRGRLAARVPFGLGEVVAVADESLFVNEELGKGDAAVLAAHLLVGDRAAVAFDEFHHGYTPTGTRADFTARLAGMLVGTWIGRALLVLALAGAVLAAGAAVRVGAPLPDPPPARRALREHADALGRLLENARASREALEILAAGVRRACGSRAGFASGLPAAEFRGRLERSLAPGAKGLAAALAEAESACTRSAAPRRGIFTRRGDPTGDESAARGPLKDVELARIAANLAAAKRRFLHGGS